MASYTARGDQLACNDCSALVADTDTHDLWHDALADLWAWVDRVSGASCDTARTILSAPD